MINDAIQETMAIILTIIAVAIGCCVMAVNYVKNIFLKE